MPSLKSTNASQTFIGIGIENPTSMSMIIKTLTVEQTDHQSVDNFQPRLVCHH
jgi:hypothetical protein